MKLRMHCNLRPPDVAPIALGGFWLHFVLHMRTNCYIPAFNQNFDIAIRFTDPDLLKESNNLATRRRFNAVTLTFHNFTLNVCSISCVLSNSITNLREIEQSTPQ